METETIDLETVEAEPIDEAKAGAFTGRVLGDTAAAATVVLAAIGDKLGLFKDLARGGPATSAELARRTQTTERYAREWLAGMAAAGYVTYDATDATYSLPPEHVPTLAYESGPAFFGGVHQELLGAIAQYNPLVEAFRHGGGVDLATYPDDLHTGIARFTTMWHEHLLTQVWLPAVPQAQAMLERGVDVADIGCGQGKALINLVQAFPQSRYVGYDNLAVSVEQARAHAEAAGVGDRVRFLELDAARGLPESFDLITAWDVVHDAVDPLGMLQSVREALRPGGIFLCLDINCADDPAANTGPVATLLYGFSLLLCMPVSLAHGGAGLGTLGLPESKLRELATSAGFSSVTKVAMDNPINNLYVVRR
ncbi:MAG TPA: class I SAM-dependent methyltransferase [Actinomycetota bacterium]|nr:class I SAM-dependent methyltransferase [Actinomycetota bacterium]